ncbi:ChaN family lipoprotein [Halomonas llamarensis]|uniref:ChaN family lipoprotein n=1 Tax=Halomonas llamarensis TaxID=2945104 RepID=A0ABT0SQ93_9GAMM|nr:ChaN family lipoprotein [Halomonas llamarensis]MCL7929979.1 ChaN family lipoprotein [Halomonas llamarensis]
MPLSRALTPASALLALSLLSTAQASDCASSEAAAETLIPGSWWQNGVTVSAPTLLAQAARQDVVLLGEQHDQVAHHRWQLHTLAGLAAHRDKLVIGLEMLPRDAQPALNAWVAGKLSEEAFLAESDWHNAWGFNAELYWPILHFARMEQIPLLALNIRPALRQKLASDGFDAVAAENRHHIPAPVNPSADYRNRLKQTFNAHPMGESDDEPADAAFERFLNAQLTWDVAMASALADATREDVLAVGLMGVGHVAYGDGVPHQLRALGVEAHMALVPNTLACDPPDASLADALYFIDGLMDDFIDDIEDAP